MRVLLVGAPAARARLRAEMDGAWTVAGEYPTLAEARASSVAHDAILLASIASAESDADEAPAEPLTPREHQVLALLAQGLPNKAIAARLGISDQTVKFYVASICGKLGAANRTDAVRIALRRGLISL
jgi:two-component system nitrate/nitrite response regulator NarL